MEYFISTWSGVKDNAVKPYGHGDWTWLVETLKKYTVTESKHSVPMYNLNVFSADFKQTNLYVERNGQVFSRRVLDNVVAITAFIIDYDNDSILQKHWTMDEVHERFKQYRHLIYTSYSHGKNEHIEKFRLILPLSEPFEVESPDEYRRYTQSIKDFFGYVEPGLLPEELWQESEEGHVIKNDKASIDKVSFVPSQGFFMPSCPPGREVIYIENEGEVLSPSVFTKADIIEATPFEMPRDVVRGGEGRILKRTFDSVQWFKDNNLYIKSIGGGKHSVVCPRHYEHTGGNKSGTVIICREGKLDILKCHHNHSIDMWSIVEPLGEAAREYCLVEQITGADEFLAIRRKHREEALVNIDDILEYPEGTGVAPFTRAERLKLIEKRCVGKKKDITLLYAFEGFGKSYYATLEAKRGVKVLFASLSNYQAAEQAESFREKGLRVQLITGREYLLKRDYDITVETYEKGHPWDSESINKIKTLKAIQEKLKCTSEEALEVWASTTPDDPDWDNHDMICTTFTRTMVWGRQQAMHIQRNVFGGKMSFFLPSEFTLVPKDTLVFFDDPDRDFFTYLAPFDEKYVGKTIDGKEIEETIVNDSPYFVRPESYTLGYGLIGTRKVFTTTEVLTKGLIHNMYEGIYEPKLMPDDKMIVGDITMIKTDIVRKKKDALILPIMMRLKKEGYEFEYFADGHGVEWNLTNTKGQNQFTKSDTVIELSEPNPNAISKYIDELKWDKSEFHTMKIIIALDQLQQAIGRNSGYRWSDSPDHDRRRCVVLCEPKLYKPMIEAMRYAVTNCVDDVENVVGLKKPDEKDLKLAVCWYLKNLIRYMKGGCDYERNAFLNDVKSALKFAKMKHVYRGRLNEALDHLLGDKKVCVGGLGHVLSRVKQTINVH